MGSCQNYGPFWGTLNSRCRIILGTQKGTIILRTTHILRLLGPKTILYKAFGAILMPRVRAPVRFL